MKKSFSTKSLLDRRAWSNPDASNNINALNTILKRQKFSVANIKAQRPSVKANASRKKFKPKRDSEKLKPQKQYCANNFLSSTTAQTISNKMAT